MKKMIHLLAITILAACSETDQGRQNACQYVREQMPEQMVNIKRVEVVKEDSVLSPFIISLGVSDIYSKRGDYYGGDITIEQWHAYTDSMLTLCFDFNNSWIMDKERTDSLKQLPKYRDSWRKAYLVEVIMKSGATKQYRVCMNEDGITPSMTSEEYIKRLDEFTKALNEL